MVCNTNITKNVAAEKVLVRSPLLTVLNGNYPAASVSRMGTVRLEKLLTQLVSCTSELGEQGGKKGGEEHKRPKWWPKDMDFEEPITLLRTKMPCSLKWSTILRRLIVVCSQFCNDRQIGTTVKWRQDETKENVVSTKKRKAAENAFQCVKRRKPDTPECRILRSKVLSAINTNPVNPFVRLYDILKPPRTTPPPIVTQDDFLRGFGLLNKTDSACVERKRITPSSLKLLHMPQVPFSSDYGRIVINRDRQPVPMEVHLRKIERLEWYLNDANSSPATSNNTLTLTYPVTHDRVKESSFHTYKFPRKQFYQGDSTLRTVSFLLSFCKPLSVVLTRIDPNLIKRKTKTVRDVKVIIRRLNLKKMDKKPVVVLHRLPVKI